MTANEIYKAVKTAVDDEGYKLVVLQSGEDLSYSDDELIKLIEKIKKNVRVFIFISVDERSRDFYQRAFDVGASGSLFRFETSNAKLYEIMRPGHNLKSRLDSLEMQIKMGYYVASGSIIGLPGQTISDMAEDLLLVKTLGVPMLSSGSYISSKNNLFEKITKIQDIHLRKSFGGQARNKQITNYKKSVIPSLPRDPITALAAEKIILKIIRSLRMIIQNLC
jgi:biotin synthase-like enzyme